MAERNAEEICDGCAENRGEFLEKLQRARSQIKGGTPSQPILSTPTSSRLVVGNWTLSCKRAGELQIHNSDGQQVGGASFGLKGGGGGGGGGDCS